jgi:hypothetical protein
MPATRKAEVDALPAPVNKEALAASAAVAAAAAAGIRVYIYIDR